MASTNKTTTLSLSQYTNSDKPSYLHDYNSDMLKIDEYARKTNLKIRETSWQKLEVVDTNYQALLNTTYIKRIGNVVYLSGRVIGSKKEGATDTKLFKIPEGFRPNHDGSTGRVSFNQIVFFNDGATISYGHMNYALYQEGGFLEIYGLNNNPLNMQFTTSWVAEDNYFPNEIEESEAQNG